METNTKRQIAGSLKYQFIACWVIFSIHFIYFGIFHGICQKYINTWDIVIDVILIFSIEAIAILLTLSNRDNNFKLFTIAFIISIINTIFALFYIFVVVYTIFVKKEKDGFIKAEIWPKYEAKTWHGVILIIIKVIEITPLFIIIISKIKLDSPTGTINPENIGKIKNDKEEEDDELE